MWYDVYSTELLRGGDTTGKTNLLNAKAPFDLSLIYYFQCISNLLSKILGFYRDCYTLTLVTWRNERVLSVKKVGGEKKMLFLLSRSLM